MVRKAKEDYALAPFKIVVDTREGAPWFFKGLQTNASEGRIPLVVMTTTKGLRTGDYSIEGLEDQVCIERKSVQDLYMSVSAERGRFEREFERMSAMRWAGVIVEGDLHSIAYNPPPRTRVLPQTVLHTIISWSIRYPNVHWFPCPSRDFAEQWCYHVLHDYWKKHVEGSSRL